MERTGKITPLNAPVKGELVEDPERGHGTVSHVLYGASGVYVRFPEATEDVLYTYRSALRVWKAFPGPADAPGLVPLE